MKYTFLIADDESVEREGLSFLLTRRGYPIRILEAVNGEQALEIVSREPVDVLITDIRMPFMDGLELARRIRERDARMKILVCTAYGEFEYAQKAISSGVTAYLLKPVQREEFYEKIDQVLAWLDEEEKRSQPAAPDMEKIWYVLSHGYAMDDKARRALAAKGLAPDGARPVLMLVKFPGSEIESRVGEFEALLRPRVGGLWIMSNCRAMLLFEQTALLPEAKAAVQGLKLVGNTFADAQSGWYKPAVDFAQASGLMAGVGGGKFAPAVTTTRAMVAQVFMNMAG